MNCNILQRGKSLVQDIFKKGSFGVRKRLQEPNIGLLSMEREGQDNGRKQETGDTTDTWELFIQGKRIVTAHVLLLRMKEDKLTRVYTQIQRMSSYSEQTIDTYWDASDCAHWPQTFPRLSTVESGVGRVTKRRRLYTGTHLSAPEKPDPHSVPRTVPNTDSSSAVRFNTRIPSANLPAKVRMKEDTVQVQTEYSTYCGNTRFSLNGQRRSLIRKRVFTLTFICQSLTYSTATPIRYSYPGIQRATQN